MKYFKILCLLFSTILLSGCFASGARHENMAVNDSAKYSVASSNSKLHKKVSVGDVSGGTKTNPLWVSKVSNEDLKLALEDSLNKSNYASIDVSPEYRLDAKLVELKQPMVGANLKVSSVVQYKLTEIKSGKEVFNKSISAIYTAKFSSSFFAGTRLKIANEGSIKTNIEQLLQDLNELQA